MTKTDGKPRKKEGMNNHTRKVLEEFDIEYEYDGLMYTGVRQFLQKKLEESIEEQRKQFVEDLKETKDYGRGKGVAPNHYTLSKLDQLIDKYKGQDK